jgi:predicted AAA+ superfamily ATPase
MRLRDYANEITWSGLPGIRSGPTGLAGRAIDSYIQQIVERDIPELGENVRRPRALMGWLAAYGAATATTASTAKILAAATPGQSDKPGKNTVEAYREILERIWVLDPLPAWLPQFNPLKRLGQAPKHNLLDPALAARLLGATADSLLRGDSPYETRTEAGLLAALFESLAAMTVRVFAQAAESTVSHMRTHSGEHEVDLIVERPDHRVVAIEVKLGTAPQPSSSKHLNWLQGEIGDTLIDKAVITSGEFAYRQADGTAVIPLSLLGP